jgi:peroxiredoxin
MPKFSLRNVSNGQLVGNDGLAGKISVVAFICNHCPYVVGSIGQLNDTLKKFIGSTSNTSNSVSAVFISSNDQVQYPDDGPEKMAIFYQQKELCAPYLFDDTQEVAKVFGAQCTPELFVFNQSGHLIYQGAVNDSPRDPSKVTRNYLDEVLSLATSGKKIEEQMHRPMGCSIKWKQ